MKMYILEVEYNSTEFCSGSQERRPVSSVIQFHCNTNVPDSVSNNRNENVYIGTCAYREGG